MNYIDGLAAEFAAVIGTAPYPQLHARLGDVALLGDMIARPGVLQTGHFRLLSGLHADRFLAFSHVARDRDLLELVADWLSPTVAAWSADVVMAPSTAGVALASTLSRRLGAQLHLASLDEAGRAAGILGRSEFDGLRVLLVNDVVTTGQGFEALADLVRSNQGVVAGAAWFLSRSDADIGALLDAPTAYLGDLPLPAWDPGGCPVCATSEALQDALDLN